MLHMHIARHTIAFAGWLFEPSHDILDLYIVELYGRPTEIRKIGTLYFFGNDIFRATEALAWR